MGTKEELKNIIDDCMIVVDVPEATEPEPKASVSKKPAPKKEPALYYHKPKSKSEYPVWITTGEFESVVVYEDEGGWNQVRVKEITHSEVITFHVQGNLKDIFAAVKAGAKMKVEGMVVSFGNLKVGTVISDGPSMAKDWTHVCTIDKPSGLFKFCAEDHLKPTFAGICLTKVKGRFALCASDSRRLAIQYDGFTLTESDFTAKCDQLFFPKEIGEAKGKVKLYVSGDPKRSLSFMAEYDNKIRWDFMVEGQFPRVEQVFPDIGGDTPQYDLQDFLYLFKNILPSTKSPSHVIYLDKNGDISVKELGVVNGDDPFDILMNKDKAPKRIGINAKYLIDALEFTGVSGPYVTGELAPLLFGNRASKIAIVMPIQVKEES